MMEPGDMAVLETAVARRTGSTPVIGTFIPLSSKDRTPGYEPGDGRSSRSEETDKKVIFWV